MSQRDPLSPPQTASSQAPVIPTQPSAITHKSHRLRTSPVPGEGSTFVPVVKFSQPFTQRNALRGVKPVFGATPPELIEQPQEGDIAPIPRPPGRGVEARTHGWTISITTSSSNPTDDDVQVEIQQHVESALQTQQTQPLATQQGVEPRVGRLLGGAVVPPRIISPIPPQIPTLSHDRIILTKEHLSQIRIKSYVVLALGLLFPPLWVLMGWGHTLDGFILPPMGGATYIQKEQILQIYRPFRIIASGLAGLVVLGTFIGIIIGGLALGGIIV
jgi:hypothetical protein